MLQASRRKSRAIKEATREENALFLTSEAGIIRLIPQTDRAVRVSWTENGSFGHVQGDEYADLSGSFTFTDTRNWKWTAYDRDRRVERWQVHMILT